MEPVFRRVHATLLLHEDGHQEGVAVGYTRRGLKPCHRPLIAALAESKRVANDWLRPGNTACVSGAAEFLRQTVASLPSQVRVGLVRGDAGFGEAGVQAAAEALGLQFLLVARLTQKVQTLCRHDDAAWQTTEVAGLEVQEVALERPGRHLIVIRQRVAERPAAGGKVLLEVAGYRFQALVTNLPASVDVLGVWRRYNGRAEIENRIRELGEQFGIKRLCCRSFWATEALHPLAIAAYNLCVLLQRWLGQLEKCELNTLRWRLFAWAAVWSRARGKPTLRLAQSEARRHGSGGSKSCSNGPPHPTAMQLKVCKPNPMKPTQNTRPTESFRLRFIGDSLPLISYRHESASLPTQRG